MQTISPAIATQFNAMAVADGRLLSFDFWMSWLRTVSDNGFGIVDTSTVDSCLVKGQASVLTPIDSFEFTEESERVISLEYEKMLEEPLGGLSYGSMDCVLDNTDKKLTPFFDATIGNYILPNRPVKMAIGFKIGSDYKNIPIFKGLSASPKENKANRQVSIACVDYLSFLNDLQMDSEIYLDKRSDEIIEAILIEAGLGSSQYILDEGLNTIGYAWFKNTMTAGNRIRKICEAEEANFYQDENGIIRFENRRKYTVSPFNASVWTFTDEDILEWQQADNVRIINRCKVTGTPRKEGSKTEIWSNGMVETLGAGETLEIWAEFENPCLSIEDPVATQDFTANTAEDGSGDDVSSQVAITAYSFTETVKLSIKNNYGGTVYLTWLRLMGTPAVIKSKITQEFSDGDSIDQYDERLLEIENDYIDSDSFAYYLARTIVRKYRNPLKRVVIKVRGVPHLQLKDRVTVYDRDLETNKDYRVMKIQGVFADSNFYQNLTLREITDLEADSWAIVDTTTVDNQNEVVGI